jgi:lipid II:glycine glycyltransferase (peptidoglycan interpeptide bridge formation enzyme)
MHAKRVEINWHPGLPIFACEAFLKTISDEYGWLGGNDESGKLRCILPYTIPIGEGLDVGEEKSFLNSVIEFFRSIGADMIIPATTNTIFRTYPDGADAAPYGSYVIDLCQPEDILWRNVAKISRQNIGTAQRNGVSIQSGIEYLDVAYKLVVQTFRRSNLPFMSYESFKRYVLGLGENGKILIADYQGVAQSCTAYAFSDYCAYAVYGGNLPETHQGTMKLVQWEAIRLFQKLGVQRFDFVGARIDPEKGSKQEAINSFKRRFGAKLKQGYMWKYSLHPLKYRLYCLASRLRSGGDIVDAERHKLKSFNALATDSSEASNDG